MIRKSDTATKHTLHRHTHFTPRSPPNSPSPIKRLSRAQPLNAACLLRKIGLEQGCIFLLFRVTFLPFSRSSQCSLGNTLFLLSKELKVSASSLKTVYERGSFQRWSGVKGAPGGGNSGALFPPRGLKNWGNQNPGAERCVERAPDWSWVPGEGSSQTTETSRPTSARVLPVSPSGHSQQEAWGRGNLLLQSFQSVFCGPAQNGEWQRVAPRLKGFQHRE